jgi:hypothetical protein
VKDEKSASECQTVIGEVTEGREWLEGSAGVGIYPDYGERASMPIIFKKELYLQQGVVRVVWCV